MTLRERLERFLKNQNKFIPSGEIQRIVAEKTSYSPSNCTRRLREMETDGVLEVKYVKGHAHYRYRIAPKYWTNQQSLDFFESYKAV